MSESRTIYSLGIENIGKAYFLTYQEDSPPPDHFRIETLYSGISAGTERSFLQGTNPYLKARWDEQFGVFYEGEPTTHYPVPFLGYMEVGRVAESRTPQVQEGQVVAMTYGHKTGHTVDPRHEFFVPLPDDLDPMLGIYVAQMGPICANGVLHAAADLVGPDVRSLSDGIQGRHVLVMGAGVVGLLIGLFARLCGAAEVVVASSTQPRLAAATAMGLTTVNEKEIEAWRYCKERWHHGPHERGADVVFQTHPDPASLRTALRSLRPQGTVIDLAFYQGGAPELRLGEEFHHNGLSICCAQINRVPRGLASTWNRRRLSQETIALLRAYGPMIRESMVTHRIPFKQGLEFVSKLTEYQPEIIQAVLEVK
jgi:threonine dehydrogenase-like Zn-dependent dehydrogenase